MPLIPTFGSAIDLNSIVGKLMNDVHQSLEQSITQKIEDLKLSSSFGHINNKKGMSATTTAAGTVVYALSTIEQSSGRTLAIRTFKGSTGDLTEGRIIGPELPYRIFLNDYNFFTSKITPQILNNNPDLFLSYNPGITRTGNTFNIHADFVAGTTSMIQLNLTRNQLNTLTCADRRRVYRDISRNKSLMIKDVTVFANDLQASMVVETTANPNIDNIYLTVCSRVDIKSNYKMITTSAEQVDGGYTAGYWYYTVPVTVKFQVDKTTLTTTTLPLIPSIAAWTFPISNDWVGTQQPTAIGKINNIATSYSSQMWNYNILPSRIRPDDFRFAPKSFGCLADMCVDSTGKVFIYSAVGNYFTGKEGSGSPYRQTHTLCSTTFPANGFNLPNTNGKAIIIDTIDELATRITIQSINDTYIAAAMDSRSTGRSYVHLSFYTASNLAMINSMSFSDSTRSDLTIQGGDLYFFYDSHLSKFWVYKFPTIDLTLLNKLTGFFNIYQIPEFLTITCGLTLIGTGPGTISGTKLVNFNFSELPGKNFVVDISCQDVSIIQDLTSTNVGKHPYFVFGSDDVHAIQLILYEPEQFVGISTRSASASATDTWSTGYTFYKLFVIQEVGFNSNEYCMLYVKYDSTKKGMVVSWIKKYAAVRMTLGANSVPRYWYNPTLGTDYDNDLETELNDNKGQGIKFLLEVPGCSGVYSSGTLTTTSYNESLTPTIYAGAQGGVAIDPYTRSDMTFKYAGNKTMFNNAFTSWQGGYWAQGDGSVEVKCTNSNGDNILYGDTKQTLNFDVWHYNHSGYFTLNLGLLLDLSNTGATYPYNHPDFALLNNNLNVIVKNNQGKIISTQTYTFDIDPPNGYGVITSNGNVTKSIWWIEFTMARNATKGDDDYTELLNVTRVTRSIRNKTSATTTPYSYKDGGLNSDRYSVHVNSIDKGDYVYYKYEPKLNGTKSIIAAEDGVAYSEFVTNVRGHKYWIDNVLIKFGFGGSFGDDVSEQIKNLDPYLYVDITNTSCEVKATLDINHENWADGSFRDSYPSTSVYPLISGIYLLAVDESQNPNQYFSLNDLVSSKKAFKAYDNATTYPNIDREFNSTIKHLIDVTADGIYATGIFMTPTVTDLASQDVIVEIKKSGKYRLYVEVEDEYGQFSTWCLTNKKVSYNYPF